MSDFGIGSTIWRYDINHREYTKPKDGRIWGDIIERAHWRPIKITGETSRSWVTQHGQKLPKNGAWRGVLLSEAAIDEWEWARKHRHRIADVVGRSDDAILLRQIAALVGYEVA